MNIKFDHDNFPSTDPEKSLSISQHLFTIFSWKDITLHANQGLTTAPLPPTTIIPMSDPLQFLACFLTDSAETIQDMCQDDHLTSEGVRSLIARHANVPQAKLATCSVLTMLPVTQPPPPLPPPLPLP